MDWGMKNRLSKIIQPKDGHTVMLAVDHGYFMGPTTGLEKLDEMVKPLIPYADVLMPTRGALRNYIPPDTDIPICLRVSGGTSILNQTNLLHEGIIVSIEDAIRLNVSALTCSIFVGGEYEKQSLLNLSKLVNWGQEYGIPTLAVTAVGREMVRDARYLGMASRMAAEMGATMVKTYYCENFDQVTGICPSPVVIAGGKKIPEKDALQMSKNAVDNGAVGVDMGRNIFQSDSPIGMIQAVRAVVHENASVDEAFEIYKNGPKGL